MVLLAEPGGASVLRSGEHLAGLLGRGAILRRRRAMDSGCGLAVLAADAGSSAGSRRNAVLCSQLRAQDEGLVERQRLAEGGQQLDFGIELGKL